MTLKALFYAYVLGGITFIPLVIAGLIFFTIYTSVPVGDPDLTKSVKAHLEGQETTEEKETETNHPEQDREVQDAPRTRKGWLTMRRTFEESTFDGSYVTLMRSFLDSRSNDPKRSRPKDMWYVVLKGKVLYLYEDEGMTECEAAIELGSHDVAIFPEGLMDGELFAKRNAICLKPKAASSTGMPSITNGMKLTTANVEEKVGEKGGSAKKQAQEREKLVESEKKKEAAREEALNPSTPWFIFVRSNVEMEDWYFSLLHASEHPAQSATLAPLLPVFQPADMGHLVVTLDSTADVIPMRWLNALLGRLFFSYYRTDALEANIIGRLMKKLSKVKRPTFLTDIVVTEVSVGNRSPTLSKPMLKELTKEGDAALEVHLLYKGEFRITIEATATISLGAFKSYTVKLALAAVIKEIEGNLLIKVKRPPSNRIWYAFTQTPRMVLEVVPIVSDRQITWGMILSTIESRLKEIIQESVVMPNMDDISFFESDGFQRRGGIWADASRQEKGIPADINPETAVDASGNPLPTIAEPETSVSTAPEAVPLTHSQSAEELAPLPSVPVPPEAMASRSSPAVIPSLVGDSPNTKAQRKSWFSSIRSEDAQSIRDDSERGRPLETSDLTPARSKSTPGANEVRLDDNENSSYEHDNSVESSSHLSLSRSNSRQSSSRDHAKNASVDGSGSFSSDSIAQAFSKPAGSPPNGQSSFLSTLKSRDKQAISNTAKEAMRKWGVNWGGLRKESGSNGMNVGSSSGRGSPSPSSDDLPDHGSIGSNLRADLTSNAASLAQKGRASYAEVRAAVAERKERERTVSGTSDMGEAPFSTSSSPIAIPASVKGKGRSVSNPFLDGTVPPVSQSGSSPNRSSNSISNHIPPSISRTTTELHPSTLSSEGHDLATQRKTSNPKLNHPSRILVQPQAKTMTIPGIHASHRGDVMSMGYVAPQPQPVPASDGILKAPAIQSVYRLWKSPQLTPQTSESQPSIEQQDTTALPPILTPAQSRPPPPPLPPRSTPIAAPTNDIPSQAAAEGGSTNTNHISPSLSASHALQTIAIKDEETRSRTSLERASTNTNTGSSSRRTSLVPQAPHDSPTLRPVEEDVIPAGDSKKLSNPGPPLPPRRTQTSTTLPSVP